MYNQRDHLQPHRELVGWGLLSTEMGIFVDGKRFLRLPAIKRPVFLAGRVFSSSTAKIRPVFLAGKVADKKETPKWGCLHNMYIITRRINAASSASARCSPNIEAAGTPGPILLPQAAALQKPTGLFADRLRP